MSDEELAKGSAWRIIADSPKLCEVLHLFAIFGAIAAQETLKASGLYTPIRQFLLYDCDEVLDTSKDAGTRRKSYASGQPTIGQKS
jgi:hypothetical protein